MPPAEFDPKKHLIQLKGKWYLETKYRIQWFREQHPNGCISTEIISFDPMMVKATVYNEAGAVLATAHATAVDKGNVVWSGRGLEKSETAAIGRALAHAGYGTQFAGTDEASDDRRPAQRSDRSTPTGDTPPARSARPSWFDSDSAQAAVARRLTAIHPDLTLERAERLTGQPMAAYNGIESAMKAVQAAHDAWLATEPA